MNPLQNSSSHSVFNNGLPTTTTSPPIIHPQLHHSVTPPQRATPPLSAPSPQNTPYLPNTIGPQSSHVSKMYAPMTSHSPTPQIPMQTIGPPPVSFHAPVTTAPHALHQTHTGASYAPSVTSTSNFTGLKNSHVANFQPQAAVRLPQTFMQTTSIRNPSPQPLPSNPAPAGKLDKLLERLGSHFPQCTRYWDHIHVYPLYVFVLRNISDHKNSRCTFKTDCNPITQNASGDSFQTFSASNETKSSTLISWSLTQ